MVREVSEDHTYDTIEFNEFLQMMSKQMTRPINTEDLIDAFRFCSNNILLTIDGVCCILHIAKLS